MDPQNPPGSSHGQQQQRQQPVYDTSQGGHYGASATLSAQGFAPVPELYTGAWANVNQGLHGNYRDILTTYWQQIIHHLENDAHDYKLHHLPLARIKKVMKADPEVKMISAEAPILFAKGCDIFITELTMRAWIHAEENKRRTLQRSDIASALAKSDMFDFLIDIVPREEAAGHAKRTATGQPSSVGVGGGGGSTSGGVAPAGGGQLTQQQQQAPPPPPPPQTQPQQPHPQPQQQPQPQPQPHPQPQHPMAHPDYASLGSHGMGPEPADYRPQPGIYGGQVQPGPGPAYGQPGPQPTGMYGEMEGMYGYPAMAPQQKNQKSSGGPANSTMISSPTTQQMYQMSQRSQDPSAGHHHHHHQDPSGHGAYQRHHHDGGEGDADAEGERDYEVG
ncbi:MAG: hypothetical protein M1837_005805 [Sclerophora amabilis]|nr:MAG: hypothetical protein M1837_005805 [Sclerophora amabilis]